MWQSFQLQLVRLERSSKTGKEESEIRRSIEKIKSPALLRWVILLRRVTKGDFLYLKLQGNVHQVTLVWKTRRDQNLLGTDREAEIRPYEQMVYAQLRICLTEWDAQTPLGFWDTNRSPNLGQTLDLIIINKKRTCRIVNFPFPADHRVKLKENEKRISFSTLLGNWKNCGTWNWQWY